jgi:hypothetical protein
LYDIYMYFAEKNMYFVCVYYCCMFVLKFTRNIAFDRFIAFSLIQQRSRLKYQYILHIFTAAVLFEKVFERN